MKLEDQIKSMLGSGTIQTSTTSTNPMAQQINSILQGTANRSSGLPSLSSDYTSLIQRYFPQSEWGNAQKIMQIESGRNPMAHNGNSATGDDSWGLFQINRFGNLANSRPPVQDLVDPEKNVAYAANMWKNSGWLPWKNSAIKAGLIRKGD